MTHDEFEGLLDRGESLDLDWKRDFPPGLIAGSRSPGWTQGKGTVINARRFGPYAAPAMGPWSELPARRRRKMPTLERRARLPVDPGREERCTGPGFFTPQGESCSLQAALETSDAVPAADRANLFKTFSKVYFARRQRIATFMATGEVY